MFQEAMSPKVLNTDKLEKKFASLTKSRESILGLSTWIIRHKEFYKEIVDQWLDALSKDMNALPMFYVANDVIQNCGRKKAPEFREAFAAILERAVALENVKEIKNEVIRMITLWHERSIYDAAFYKKLQDKLNDVEESECEEELDEVDIIANFKLEKLTDSLQKLKSLEEELLEKEEFLEDIEEPGVKNIDNSIVKMDSQKELRKVDKFQKLVESYLSLADKVMTAQKEAILNLKYSSIFYSAQLEDAKKVAHAYRIYGKKVKIVEKGLTEKLVNLPEASPVLLEEKSPNIEMNSSLEFQSPGLSMVSDVHNENTASNQSNSLDLNTSLTMNETGSFMNANSLNEQCKSPVVELHDSVSTLSKCLSNAKKGVKNPTVLDVINIVKEIEEKILKSPMAIESVAESAAEDIENLLKSPLVDMLKKNDKILKSPISVDVPNSQTKIDTSTILSCENISKNPLITEKVRKTSTDKKSKSPVAVETVRRISTDKVSQCTTPVSLEVTFDKEKTTSGDMSDSIDSNLDEKALKSSSSGNESLAKKICSLENEEISSTSKEIKKTSEPDLQILSDIENIDFLLEKSYNEQRTKSKGSFKRKIDNLLKMKQSKTFKLSGNDDNLKKTKTSVSETSVVDDSDIVSCSNVDDGRQNDVFESLMTKEEDIVISGNLDTNEKTGTTSSSEEIKDEENKVDQSLEITQNSKASDSGTTSENIPLPTSVSFSNFPDIPTELLKNILDKHRTNMNNSSSTADSYSATNDRPIVPDVKTENMKMSDSDQNSLNNNSITNDKKDTSPGSDFDQVLDSETGNKTSNVLEESVLDNANDTSIIKDDSKADAENITEKHCIAKATPLMENLQKLLKCFTEKGPALEELKNSKTLKTLPAYSLKSTLKLYHVLQEHHKNDNALNSSSVNNNSLPDFSPETASSVNNKSSVCNYNSTNAFAHSKKDNLEIMDMEVDSDDDTK